MYFDNASTTPIDPSVVLAMREIESKHFANPSSIHSPGQQSKFVIEKSREIVANSINASKNEIIFTSGGTESNNLALFGCAIANREKGRHIITTKIEHPSVLNTCRFLETIGFKITYIDVDIKGKIDLEKFTKLLDEETILVSIMMVNNELGNILPVREIGELVSQKDILFHCDAVQAFTKLDFNIEDLNIDLASFSSHKLYGPKGVGALYFKSGTKIQNIFFGGAQENGFRAGTENVVGIASFGEAIEQMIIKKNERKIIKNLRDTFERELKVLLPEIEVNCENTERMFNFSNIYFPNIALDSLILNLDLDGISCSSGSACSSGALNPSHVLQAMKFGADRASQSIRFTFGRFNTEEEINCAVSTISTIYNRIKK